MFAPSVLSSAAGISVANPASRRSSFRATTQEPNMYKENSPSPESNDAALFVEEDRRMRRRGSQLYVVDLFIIFIVKVLCIGAHSCAHCFHLNYSVLIKRFLFLFSPFSSLSHSICIAFTCLR